MRASDEKRGPARMKELGHRLVTVWLDPTELAAVEDAAKRVKMSRAALIRAALTHTTNEILAGYLRIDQSGYATMTGNGLDYHADRKR